MLYIVIHTLFRSLPTIQLPTMVDLENGNVKRATKRMNTGDGGLAKHISVCEHSVNWEEAKIVERERDTMKRKYKG